MLVAGATFMRKPTSAKSNDFFSIHVLLLFVCKLDQNPPISLVDRMHTRVIFSILYVLYCIRGIQPCGKGLTYWLFLLCFCHFPMWCSGSGVVLDCIDS